MSDQKCGRCGKDPAEGFATINDVRYCHGDDDLGKFLETGVFDLTPTCYMRGPLYDNREQLVNFFKMHNVLTNVDPGDETDHE